MKKLSLSSILLTLFLFSTMAQAGVEVFRDTLSESLNVVPNSLLFSESYSNLKVNIDPSASRVQIVV